MIYNSNALNSIPCNSIPGIGLSQINFEIINTPKTDNSGHEF